MNNLKITFYGLAIMLMSFGLYSCGEDQFEDVKTVEEGSLEISQITQEDIDAAFKDLPADVQDKILSTSNQASNGRSVNSLSGWSFLNDTNNGFDDFSAGTGYGVEVSTRFWEWRNTIYPLVQSIGNNVDGKTSMYVYDSNGLVKAQYLNKSVNFANIHPFPSVKIYSGEKVRIYFWPYDNDEYKYNY